MFTAFAAESVHINLKPDTILTLGPLPVTNSMILGTAGVLVMLTVLGIAAWMINAGKKNAFTLFIQWAFDGMYGQISSVVQDPKVAKGIAPLALTIFFVVLSTYWMGVMPGVGSLTYNGKELLRELPSDLNFTFAIAIIAMVAVQFYAVREHGFFGNLGRYIMNPIKNAIGTFEGFLELIGELSRLVALSLRLFGNAFAGGVLLLIIGTLSGWFAPVSLPIFMIYEIFIGFIQAYVFFMLTLIFTSLATASHGAEHHTPPKHSPAPKQLRTQPE